MNGRSSPAISPWQATGLDLGGRGEIEPALLPYNNQGGGEVSDKARRQKWGENADIRPSGKALAEHILAMVQDPYLMGHPEWNVICEEAAEYLGLLANGSIEETLR